jgi:membrane-associated protein
VRRFVFVYLSQNTKDEILRDNMPLLTHLLDLILHVDRHLSTLVAVTGNWSYVVLGLVIFCETGLVVTPFLPGDSFLFAVGALSATDVWQTGWVWLALTSAAILGDTVNYSIGGMLGSYVKKNQKLFGIPIKASHIARTEQFYAKHGAKAIVMARFVPIIRTFAPFVAGMAQMEYQTFLAYNFIGGISWVSLFLGLGYFFGNLPIVKERFGIVVILIVIISLIPIVREYFASRIPDTDIDSLPS